jgi:hypothetical protein
MNSRASETRNPAPIIFHDCLVSNRHAIPDFAAG